MSLALYLSRVRSSDLLDLMSLDPLARHEAANRVAADAKCGRRVARIRKNEVVRSRIEIELKPFLVICHEEAFADSWQLFTADLRH